MKKFLIGSLSTDIFIFISILKWCMSVTANTKQLIFRSQRFSVEHLDDRVFAVVRLKSDICQSILNFCTWL